jgi:uncharacterized OsmC-like protein
MKTARVVYEGDLRTRATHLRSGDVLLTDAPPDNEGKGEAFSPTDLVAAAALTCMITTMGIFARRKDLELGQVSGEVEKVMADNPRRISALNIELVFEGQSFDPKEKAMLENVAMSCPVTRSIHPDIVINLSFSYR